MSPRWLLSSYTKGCEKTVNEAMILMLYTVREDILEKSTADSQLGERFKKLFETRDKEEDVEL